LIFVTYSDFKRYLHNRSYIIFIWDQNNFFVNSQSLFNPPNGQSNECNNYLAKWTFWFLWSCLLWFAGILIHSIFLSIFYPWSFSYCRFQNYTATTDKMFGLYVALQWNNQVSIKHVSAFWVFYWEKLSSRSILINHLLQMRVLEAIGLRLNVSK